MTDASTVGLATAFAAGIVSFVSPCVLPLVPGYISYVAGQSLHDANAQISHSVRVTAIVMSAFFVLGFSAVFIALGASATALGQFLLQYRYQANIIGGIVIVAVRKARTPQPKPVLIELDEYEQLAFH